MFASSDLLQHGAGPIPESYRICELETVDGSVLTAWAPRYHVEPARLGYVAGDYRVKVTGFDEKSVHGLLRGTSTPFNYQAPELVFGSQLGPSVGIWSCGCTV